MEEIGEKRIEEDRREAEGRRKERGVEDKKS